MLVSQLVDVGEPVGHRIFHPPNVGVDSAPSGGGGGFDGGSGRLRRSGEPGNQVAEPGDDLEGLLRGPEYGLPRLHVHPVRGDEVGLPRVLPLYRVGLSGSVSQLGVGGRGDGILEGPKYGETQVIDSLSHGDITNFLV